jgi:zinc-finger binding domain of transposase IS66
VVVIRDSRRLIAGTAMVDFYGDTALTETLELIPRQWKVIQHVREKFSCRACEAITQPLAPSHPIARGRAGTVIDFDRQVDG